MTPARPPVRSWLFVPADSERKLARGPESGADALILDLEDAVAPPAKAAARAAAAAFLRAHPPAARPCRLWVRINAFDTGLAAADLAAVAAEAPDGIVLPKCDGPVDVLRLGHGLDTLEAQAGLASGAIGVLPVATETAAAPFRLGDYAAAALPRLAGLTWGAEDLATALGASTNRTADGGWALTFRLVRSLTLMAARAAGVQPVDTLWVDFRDEAGLRAACAASRAEGFAGRLAIHPAQVGPINEGYLPDAAERAHAARVLAAFAAAGEGGVASLDGRMLDVPHRRQAEALLAAVAARGA